MAYAAALLLALPLSFARLLVRTQLAKGLQLSWCCRQSRLPFALLLTMLFALLSALLCALLSALLCLCLHVISIASANSDS